MIQTRHEGRISRIIRQGLCPELGKRLLVWVVRATRMHRPPQGEKKSGHRMRSREEVCRQVATQKRDLLPPIEGLAFGCGAMGAPESGTVGCYVAGILVSPQAEGTGVQPAQRTSTARPLEDDAPRMPNVTFVETSRVSLSQRSHQPATRPRDLSRAPQMRPRQGRKPRDKNGPRRPQQGGVHCGPRIARLARSVAVDPSRSDAPRRRGGSSRCGRSPRGSCPR